MPATAAYQAGFDTTQTQISYGIETTWATLPTVQFKALRINSENMRGTKTRGRPPEIRSDRQASGAVTMQEAAGGSIGFPLVYGVYDDLLSTLFGNDWQTGLAINDSTIAITTGNVITASTANLFQNIELGQFIKLGGFATATNNRVVQVSGKASNTNITCTSSIPLVNEAAGARTIGTGGFLKNGTQVQTLYMQQRFASGNFLRYPGVYITGATLEARLGSFLSGNFALIAQQEFKSTTDASTGAVLAASTGAVHDPVSNQIAFHTGGTALANCLSFSLNIQNDNASMQYGLGSPIAQGMQPGVFTASGQVELYFKDFTQYDLFKAETQFTMGFVTQAASAGASYGISIPSGALMNPDPRVTGPGQPVIATFDIECNPSTTGHTLRIDRMP